MRPISEVPQPDAPVPVYADSSDLPSGMHRAFVVEAARWGRVRNLTNAIAPSVSTWQAVIRAEHLYVSLRRVDPSTQAILCLFTSILNGCAYCIDDAAAAALKENVTANQLRALHTPSSVFDTKVVAALNYTKWIVQQPSSVPNSVISELRHHVEEEEFLELTALVAMKCFWNHFVSALHILPEGHCTDHELFRDLCALSTSLREPNNPVELQ
ncbi:carboxymuconolactone decarboxylase family protein [Lentzea aerocolonigenes]|uniref:carboxymuconolactone decarboxylase family protein n=1 Tax=Lentzea aerocolonigenes TaxID=68170 RepID=UPI0009DFB96A|nr:carboxymuconolactone decarboxylase family protein [Lentzea aerocolonigenes]